MTHPPQFVAAGPTLDRAARSPDRRRGADRRAAGVVGQGDAAARSKPEPARHARRSPRRPTPRAATPPAAAAPPRAAPPAAVRPPATPAPASAAARRAVPRPRRAAAPAAAGEGRRRAAAREAPTADKRRRRQGRARRQGGRRRDGRRRREAGSSKRRPPRRRSGRRSPVTIKTDPEGSRVATGKHVFGNDAADGQAASREIRTSSRSRSRATRRCRGSFASTATSRRPLRVTLKKVPTRPTRPAPPASASGRRGPPPAPPKKSFFTR